MVQQVDISECSSPILWPTTPIDHDPGLTPAWRSDISRRRPMERGHLWDVKLRSRRFQCTNVGRCPPSPVKLLEGYATICRSPIDRGAMNMILALASAIMH